MRVFAVLIALAMTILTTDCLSVEPGVSRTLALARAKQIKDLHYSLRFKLEEGADRLTGTVDIRFRLAAAQRELLLDWRGKPVRDLRIDGKAGDAKLEQEHLILPALKAGQHRISLAFEAPISVSGTV